MSFQTRRGHPALVHLAVQVPKFSRASVNTTAMVDFLTPQERSARMAAIPSKNTSPEVALRRGLHRLGLRFRLHVSSLPGKPDLVFPRFKTVVFVHGCFWHRHQGCNIASTPKSNTEFWLAKFSRNKLRDEEYAEKLRALGWRVVVIWECEVSSRKRAVEVASVLARQLREGVYPAKAA